MPQVTAVAQVQSLTQELLHAMGVAKKKEKRSTELHQSSIANTGKYKKKKCDVLLTDMVRLSQNPLNTEHTYK